MLHRLRGGWIGAVLSLALCAGGAAAEAPPEAPVIPGYEKLAESPNADPAAMGELLLGELNCLSCHAPAGQTRLMTRGAPDLSAVGKRITPQYLRQFLANPHQTKAGTSMPDLLRALPAAERDAAVEALTHFLVSQGGPIGADELGGNSSMVERGRTLYHSVGCVACHAPEKQALERLLRAASGKPRNVAAPNTPKTGAQAADVHAQAATLLQTRSVPLGHLAAKTTVSELAAFLMDPLEARPSSRMPSLELAPADAQAIAVYLLYEQLEAEMKSEATTRPVTALSPQAAAPSPQAPASSPQAPASSPQAAALSPRAAGLPKAGAAMIHPHSPGVTYEYFERKRSDDGCKLESFKKLKPAATGTISQLNLDIPGKRANDFAVHFMALLAVQQSGKYVFFSASDDGSRIYIDGKIVLDDDGIHPAREKASQEVELTAGNHKIDVTYFQAGGGASLKVSWQGPGVPKEEIAAVSLYNSVIHPMTPLGSAPFAVDAAKAEQGAQLFATLGCASCHTLQKYPTQLTAKPLASVDAASAQGCLSDTPDAIGRNVPRFDLSDGQRAAIRAALAHVKDFGAPLPPAQAALHMLAAMDCIACHKRGDIGGPGPGRAEFFSSLESQDLGDEGRLAPKLTGVGAKLLPEAIGQIVFENKLHVRPYVATRMPQFSREKLPDLAGALEQADATANAPVIPPADDAAAKDGRLLVGTRGLGCVNCHGVAGVKPLGAPSVDLSTVHDRIRSEWFVRLLHDPNTVNPGTRMPGFFTDNEIAFKDVAGGTFDGQAHAIWSYLAGGSKMALPFGIGETSDELVPGDEPIVLRAFIIGVGPRAIAVGFPESVHVAFDADVVRLAVAWRGRFFDAKDIWEKRGGHSAAPLGSDLLPMPAGPAFAFLPSPSSAWPLPQEHERNLGGHFKGYTLDKQQRPTFRYELDGVDIREQPLPLPGKVGGLSRQFHLAAPAAAASEGKELYFLAATGHAIQATSPGVWVVDQKLTVRIPPSPSGPQPIVREVAGNMQLLVPVTFNNGQANLAVEMSW